MVSDMLWQLLFILLIDNGVNGNACSAQSSVPIVFESKKLVQVQQFFHHFDITFINYSNSTSFRKDTLTFQRAQMPE